MLHVHGKPQQIFVLVKIDSALLSHQILVFARLQFSLEKKLHCRLKRHISLLALVLKDLIFSTMFRINSRLPNA